MRIALNSSSSGGGRQLVSYFMVSAEVEVLRSSAALARVRPHNPAPVAALILWPLFRSRKVSQRGSQSAHLVRAKTPCTLPSKHPPSAAYGQRGIPIRMDPPRSHRETVAMQLSPFARLHCPRTRALVVRWRLSRRPISAGASPRARLATGACGRARAV